MRANIVHHPVEYPWSSYHHNAMNKSIQLITPHTCYQSLGGNDNERRSSYKKLFNHSIPELALQEIRDATNKSWVLGEDEFRQQIEEQTGRRSSSLPQGGDRKSMKFRAGNLSLPKNQRLCPL